MKANNEAANQLTMRPRDAAATLGISESTLFRLRNTGKLPSLKVGRIVLFRRSDLEAFASNGEPALA